MIGHIVQWSLRNRLFVVAGCLLLRVWGGLEPARTPVDVFPDLTAPTVALVAEAEGLAPVDMEAQVTFPIETALNGAPGVRRVRSSTSRRACSPRPTSSRSPSTSCSPRCATGRS